MTTNEAHAKAYLDAIFQYVDWAEGGTISLLGIGEKGTPQEGKFRERKFVDPKAPFFMSAVMGHVDRWSQHQIATFIVPAVIKPEAIEANDVTLERLAAFTCIVVDVDSGDSDAKWEHAERHLGSASFVVESGGITETGQLKRHLYWLLSEPTEEIERVGVLRKMLAAKIGGDQAFGRATQVIRLPGSVYAKGGVARDVTLIRDSDKQPLEYHFDELADLIEAMPAMEGIELKPAPQAAISSTGMMDFSAGSGQSYNNIETALTTTIAEGSTDDRNRWSQFNVVAGHEISLVRRGIQTLEQALENTCGWALSKMVPPWPADRMKAEWAGILKTDAKNHGPLEPVHTGVVIEAEHQTNIEKIENTDDLLSWAVVGRTSLSPKPEGVLVEGLVFAGRKHLLVAEGGAGKTFLCMDLALALAAHTDETPQTWTGKPVTEDAKGGTVIMMTAEDDIDELDRRWHAIDEGMARRRAAGDRLIALPLDNLGGAFPLVSYHPQTREAVASKQWVSLYRAIRGIVDRGGKISAIIIDTLNSTLHGEENSAAVIAEYLRAVAPVIGDLKAALVVTHHVRKVGAEPIRTPEEMAAAVRGSGAITNGMRMVLGVWPVPDYQRRMKLMGMEPKRGALYNMAPVKWNMGGAHTDVRTLLRAPSGLLSDVTGAEQASRGHFYEHMHWLVWCIGWFADRGVFFTRTGHTNGLHAHRAKLAPRLAEMTRADLETLSEAALRDKRLITRSLDNSGKAMSYLDLPEKANLTRYADTTKAPICNYDSVYFDHGYDCIREIE